MMKKRICFIVQRYGREVNGGAELHCRMLAEHMRPYYREIHVLTSKAIDYQTWKDAYDQDEEIIHGITVHRFSVSHPREQKGFDALSRKFFAKGLTNDEESEWIEKQGPAVPGLIRYLIRNKDHYDAFIFFTYLYYPTVLGVKEVREKAIVIPTAHDEPFIRKLKIFDQVFLTPRFFFFNTEAEKRLVQGIFHNEYIPAQTGGTGVEIPEEICKERFKKKYGLENYMIYAGRIAESKNCQELLRYFKTYKKRCRNDIQLVLIGKPMIPIPKDRDIICPGFVSEQDKYDGIAAAKLLVLPSRLESLSMVVLEAMSLSTPVIVNGACDVLREHCTKSNGAFYYYDYDEFEGEVNYILEHPETAAKMCQNAKSYVEENYRWDKIEKKLCSIIEQI